jgi:pimeloyl-ACP methyl ester carboxylesterase
MPGRADVPVTLAWGGADRIVPGWMRRRWEERLPDARVETLAGLPHVPHLRDPERIAALVLRDNAHPDRRPQT